MTLLALLPEGTTAGIDGIIQMRGKEDQPHVASVMVFG